MSKENAGVVVKAGIWYTVANFLSKGAIFLTTPIFTRLMSTEQVGAFANINTWFYVLVYITTFELSTSMTLARFDFKESLDEYISSILFLGTMITAVCYSVVLLKFEFFCELFSMRGYALHIIFIYFLVYPAMLVYQAKNMFQYKYKASAIISIVTLLLSVGCALVMTLVTEDRLWGRTVGYYAPSILCCAVVYVYLMLKGKRVKTKYFKYALVIAFPMIWHSLSMHILHAGDKMVIVKYLGDSANAMYSVASNCSVIASVLWTSMNSAWSPWATERMDSGETDEMKKASHGYILLFAVVVLGLLMVTPELLWLMGGEAYMEAKGVITPIIVGCLCQFVYSLYVNVEFFLKKQKRIALGTILAAILNIVLNIIFVPRFGYIAAAYTTLFGYLMLFLFHAGSLKLLGKMHWYDNKFNFAIVGIFLLLIPIFNVLYEYNTVRYGLILAFGAAACVFGYKYRAMILDLVKKYLRK